MLGRGDTGQRGSLPDSEAWALDSKEVEGPKPGDEGDKDWGFQQPPESPLAAFLQKGPAISGGVESGWSTHPTLAGHSTDSKSIETSLVAH